MPFLSLKLGSRWKFLLAILMLASVATYALITSQKIAENVDDAWSRNNEKLVQLVDMHLTAKSVVRSLDLMAASSQPNDLAQHTKRMRDKLGQYQQLEKFTSENLGKSKDSSQSEKELIGKIASEYKLLLPKITQFEQHMAAGQTKEAKELFNLEIRRGSVQIWLGTIGDLIAKENENIAQAGISAGSAYEQLRSRVLLMCAMIVLLGLLALWQTIKRNAAEQAEAK